MGRRLLRIITLAGVLALAASPALAQPLPSSDPISLAERSVVRVVAISLDPSGEVAGVSLGSGFVAAPHQVITDHHVIAGAAGASAVRVYIIPESDGGGRAMEAQIVRDWAGADLALLSAQDLAAAPLPMTLAIPGKDEAVHALGYPGVTDEMRNLPVDQILSPAEPYVTSGSVALVSRTAPGGANFETIFHTAPINEGNSGGPLIDECGRVIGVNATVGGSLGANGEFAIAPGQSAAISGSVLARFLGPLGVPFSSAPCAAPINAAISARLAADEAAIAGEAKARADAEAKLADAAQRRRQFLIVTGVVAAIIAALALGFELLFHRSRPATAEPGESPRKPGRKVGIGVLVACVAAAILATAVVMALVLGARTPPPPPPSQPSQILPSGAVVLPPSAGAAPKIGPALPPAPAPAA